MHPGFLDILEDFRRKHPTLWLYVHSNGGVHDADYWQRMAEIMAGHGQVDFGIDGLEDTLHIYRRNVRYQTVIDNAQAFIAAGGRAQWNFIVFRHNQHQVDAAKRRARDMGFHDILIRHTGRFFHHGSVVELDSWPVEGRQGEEYRLEPPTVDQYRNRSMMSLPDLKKRYIDLDHYFDRTEISCDALKGRKVAINAEGLVLPCNFFNHNLYDRRFHEPEWLPGQHRLSSVAGKNQVRQFLEQRDITGLDIHRHSLEEIFQHRMWQDLVQSWQQDLAHGRLFECAMTCGQQLTKVWDQGGNKR